MRDKAFQALPNEACGFILSDGRIIEVGNFAEDPTSSFRMAIPDLAKKLTPEEFSQIIGIWHTHPKGSIVPSSTDIEAMRCGVINQDWLYLIATVDKVTVWHPKSYAVQDNSFWNKFVLNFPMTIK